MKPSLILVLAIVIGVCFMPVMGWLIASSRRQSTTYGPRKIGIGCLLALIAVAVAVIAGLINGRLF